MARSQLISNKKKGGNKGKVQKNKKNVISHSDRKKTKHRIEEMNKSSELKDVDGAVLHQAISHHNQALKQKKTKDSRVKSLHTKRLIHDQKKDKIIQKRNEKKNKETEDSMMKQIEMISGFSL
ncbi:antisense of depressing factor protein 1 [Monosporozyma servazzii]